MDYKYFVFEEILNPSYNLRIIGPFSSSFQGSLWTHENLSLRKDIQNYNFGIYVLLDIFKVSFLKPSDLLPHESPIDIEPGCYLRIFCYNEPPLYTVKEIQLIGPFDSESSAIAFDTSQIKEYAKGIIRVNIDNKSSIDRKISPIIKSKIQ